MTPLLIASLIFDNYKSCLSWGSGKGAGPGSADGNKVRTSLVSCAVFEQGVWAAAFTC